MATTHAKYMRCLVWQTALQNWQQFRNILLQQIHTKIYNLETLIYNLQIQYTLLKEPEIKMTKSYDVADYFIKISRKAAADEAVTKVKTPEEITKEIFDRSDFQQKQAEIATFINFIRTGGSSHDGSESYAETDASEQQSSESQNATNNASLLSNELVNPISTSSSVGSEKYTGTKPKTVKRLQRPGGEVMSVSNIQVPHPSKNSKHATAVQNPLIRRNDDVNDEKSSKKLVDAGDTGNGGGKDEDGEEPKLPPHYTGRFLSIPIGKQWFKNLPLQPTLPKFCYGIGIVELYTNSNNQLEFILKLDQLPYGRIESDDELNIYMDCNRYVSNGVNWIVLGSMNTKIRENTLRNIDWTASGIEITQELLVHIFGVEMLETHNRIGGSMPKLNKDFVADLIEFMFISKDLTQADVEKIIDEKCAELFKAKLKREQQRREQNMETNRRNGRKPQRKYRKRR